jgi:hypothetical protein
VRTSGSSGNLGFEAQLWAAANALRGSIDAGECRGGSIFGNATRSDLESLVIPWPRRESERTAIAHILGTLDDKIELNRRMSETLEQMARALFKAWFVDFEPVRAKMEGRWQRGQSLPGLPAHLYDLFPAGGLGAGRDSGGVGSGAAGRSC